MLAVSCSLIIYFMTQAITLLLFRLLQVSDRIPKWPIHLPLYAALYFPLLLFVAREWRLIEEAGKDEAPVSLLRVGSFMFITLMPKKKSNNLKRLLLACIIPIWALFLLGMMRLWPHSDYTLWFDMLIVCLSFTFILNYIDRRW